MKELFKIFVEGDADKRFISQLLEFLFKTSIDQGNIQTIKIQENWKIC